MSGRSVSWNVIGAMLAVISIIVSVTNPEVRCIFRLQSESCPSLRINSIPSTEEAPNDRSSEKSNTDDLLPLYNPPNSSSPKTNDRGGNNLISKATGIDYSFLRDLLLAGKLKEADQETTRAIIKTAIREQGSSHYGSNYGYRFSCEDLRIIDQLWFKYSEGKFSFSIQKEIYKNLGGTLKYDSELWLHFSKLVGWGESSFGRQLWKVYDSLDFNLNATRGQLPASYYAHSRLFFEDFFPINYPMKIGKRE